MFTDKEILNRSKEEKQAKYELIIKYIRQRIESEYELIKTQGIKDRKDIVHIYKHRKNEEITFGINWDYDTKNTKNFIIDLEYMLAIFNCNENDKPHNRFQ